MSLEEIISTYGYFAIAIGTFLEGETILVLGGFSAHRGYLSLPWVICAAFVGTLLGDQLYFYLGRKKGTSVLDKRPRWKARSVKVFALLERHQIALILGFRFLYGLRTVTPFLVGASGVSPLRFLVLNVVGAFIWAVVIGSAGYLFGQTLEVVMGDIKRYELWIGALVIGGGAVVWAMRSSTK